MSADSPPFYYFSDLTISQSGDVPSQCSELVLKIRPEWTGCTIIREALHGGHQNDLSVCFRDTDETKSDALVVRIYPRSIGSEFERFGNDKELIGLQVGHAIGCAPGLEAVFDNGIVYRYSRGRKLCVEDIENPVIIRKMAEISAELHSIDLSTLTLWNSQGKTVTVPTSIRYIPNLYVLLDDVPKCMQDREQNNRYQKIYSQFKDIYNEVKFVEELLVDTDFSVGMCHNDFYVSNFLYDEDTGKLSLVDWDLSQYNYIAYDPALLFLVTTYVGIMEALEDSPRADVKRDPVLWSVWCDAYTARRNAKSRDGNAGINRELFQLEIRIFHILQHFYWVAICFAMLKSDKRDDFTRSLSLGWETYMELRPQLPILKSQYKELLQTLSH